MYKFLAVAAAVFAAFIFYRPTIAAAMSGFLPSNASLQAATASNALYKPKSRPVAIFLGGTSGIGQAMAEQLARQTNGRAHIILMGRNQAAAEKIISGFPKTPASTPPEEASNYSFIKVDATSMAQIRGVASKLSQELDKINFIVISAGFINMKRRDETSEGLDRKLACNIYSRFRLIYDLLPLVEKAEAKGERTGLVSVLAAGRGGPIDVNDLGLTKTYTFMNARRHAVLYKDAVFEKLAQLHPNLGFYHIFPGGVSSPMTMNFTGMWLLLPLFRWMIVTPAESAQIMWYRVWSTEPSWKTGAHQINLRGEELAPNNYVNEEGKKAIWDHVLKMTS